MKKNVFDNREQGQVALDYARRRKGRMRTNHYVTPKCDIDKIELEQLCDNTTSSESQSNIFDAKQKGNDDFPPQDEFWKTF
jgi:hypothetical protein